MQKVKNKWIKIGSEVLILASLFTLVQYLITAGLLNQYYQINLTSMCINVILAVSLSLINGFTGQLSLGQGGKEGGDMRKADCQSQWFEQDPG
jgi:branched-chain amino acid transport system permease protein